MLNGDYNQSQPIVEVVRVLDGTLEFRDLETDDLIFDVEAGKVRFYDTAGVVTLQADESDITYKGVTVGYTQTTTTIILDDFTVNIPCAAGTIIDLAVHATRSTEAEAAAHVEVTNWKSLTPMKINAISSNAVKTSGLDIVFSINAGTTGVDVNVKNALGGTLTYSYKTRMTM